jgi:hypothetical protein
MEQNYMLDKPGNNKKETENYKNQISPCFNGSNYTYLLKRVNKINSYRKA